ncbi:MAG: DUF3467 domain-containing protein [Acidobacteriaceae bacterium]|nr:DUF3467 domain-containing protein [Acidobacteriaceae bacterium]
MAGRRREAHVDSEESNHRQPARSPSAKEGRYANFFQVGHNEFEFLIEFGQQDRGIHTRIYVSPQYAHVLSELLAETLRQHELEFGGKRGTGQRPT